MRDVEVGAKSKLTDELREKAAKLTLEGNHDEAVYKAVGISHETFYRWLREGEAAKSGKKREFYEAVECARGESETVLLSAIRGASSEDWKAAAWILERRFSSRWANTQKIEVAVEREMEGLLGVLENGLEPSEFRKVASLLAGGGA